MFTNLQTFKYKSKLFHTPINLLFLLCAFLPYILTNTETINYENFSPKTYSASDKISFLLKFPNNIKNYIHIKVESTTSYNQILYFSNKDETCMETRQLLSMSSSGSVELFLTKNQIENNSQNYLCVECTREKKCEFKLEIESEDQAKLKIGDVYTYYIFGDENKKMTFLLANENSAQNSNQIITFSNITTTLS